MIYPDSFKSNIKFLNFRADNPLIPFKISLTSAHLSKTALPIIAKRGCVSELTEPDQYSQGALEG